MSDELARRIERIRGLCLGLPEVVEKITWGDPTWRVRDRIFVMQKGNAPGKRPSMWLKIPSGDQPGLVASDPDHYFVPPYVGHKGWLGVYLDMPELSDSVLKTLIEQSYGLIAPKRLAAQLESRTR